MAVGHQVRASQDVGPDGVHTFDLLAGLPVVVVEPDAGFLSEDDGSEEESPRWTPIRSGVPGTTVRVQIGEEADWDSPSSQDTA
ncbi:MAG: hypothetical protein J0I14_16915, partial [Propionibacteriaceae bacterium]|nr:hypothetical protein [Propionibacteriaceae bacterium]